MGGSASTERAEHQLAAIVSAWTGFSREAVRGEAVRRVIDARLAAGQGMGDLLALAMQGDPGLVNELISAVSVGETYFFRHVEHFDFVVSSFIPSFLSSGKKQLRAWSAGCATGEETYSLAACLLASIPAACGVSVSVLGTDIVEHNVRVAQAGVYHRRSVRETGPVLFPLYRPADGDNVAIIPPVRALVAFARHNLLDDAPEHPEPFDIIFCRNVLVYFTPDAAQRAAAMLGRALAPGGILILGAMDLTEAPDGLRHASARGTNIFTRPAGEVASEPPVATAAPRRRAPRPQARPPSDDSLPKPIQMHLRALAHIERGERQHADRLLAELLRAAPEYLPGLLERALHFVRGGRAEQAGRLMQEILDRTSDWPNDRLIPGPEALPVSYYRASARAFFEANQPTPRANARR